MSTKRIIVNGFGYLSYTGWAITPQQIREAITSNIHANGWGAGPRTGNITVTVSSGVAVIEIHVDDLDCGRDAAGVALSMQGIVQTTTWLGLNVFDSVSSFGVSYHGPCDGALTGGIGIGNTGGGGNHTGGGGNTGGGNTGGNTGGGDNTGGGGGNIQIPTGLDQFINNLNTYPTSNNTGNKLEDFAKGLGLSVAALGIIGLLAVAVISRR